MPDLTQAPDRIRLRLRQLAEADGRPDGEIARAAGMSPQQFSQLLLGGRANPAVGTVARVLEALGRSWKDLD